MNIMRPLFVLFFSLGIGYLCAQPVNNQCSGAINLNLTNPQQCPTGGGVTNTFNNLTNVGATPSSPYPSFYNCAVGNQTSSPASDVWYTFTARGDSTTITLQGGLATPNMAIFRGDSCHTLVPIECARGTATPLTISFATTPNQRYFLMVSGGNINDRSSFSLAITSIRDCDACKYQGNLVAFPPPINGTYNSGQTVTFCYTVSRWDLDAGLEWLHGLTVNFGPGWDQSTLVTSPPVSCGGDGAWNWYETWQSCGSGLTFGPGFAYDSGSGLDCDGQPDDGDPGNNWGDGFNGCESIGNGGPDSLQFCWTITVGDCPPNISGRDLSVIATVLSDGASGSWYLTGCNSGQIRKFLASSVCCTASAPTITTVPTSCPNLSNGSVTVAGGDPDATYDYSIYNNTGQLVFQSPSTLGAVTATGLAVGQYAVVASDALTGCSRSETVLITEGARPVPIPSNTGPYCPGDTIALRGDYSYHLPVTSVTYQWSGPDGFASNQRNPLSISSFDGYYRLRVIIDGCVSPYDSTLVSFDLPELVLSANPPAICPGDSSILSVSGGTSYTWSTGSSDTSFVVRPLQTSTYTVTATSSTGCIDSAALSLVVKQVEPLTIEGQSIGCLGDTITLTAVGDELTDLLWSNQSVRNPIAVELTDSILVYSVSAFSLNSGCFLRDTLILRAESPPSITIVAAPDTVCSGGNTTLSVSNGASFQWSTGDTSAVIQVSPITNNTRYDVTVSSPAGCADSASIEIPVISPNPIPSLICDNTTPSSVVFAWDAVAGAISYEVNVLSGQNGILIGQQFQVSGLSSGTDVTIVLTSIFDNACPNTQDTLSCSTIICPPVTVSITPPGSFCANLQQQPVNLDASFSVPGGIINWSGSGITDSLNGVFDPNLAGAGLHAIILSYQTSQCTYFDTLEIPVYPQPLASFTVPADTLCLDSPTTIQYTGNASAGADYQWQFGTATAIPGNGQGPHNLTWSSAGTQTISLAVSENGCHSDTITAVIITEAPLAIPQITCTASLTALNFSWDPIPGADNYVVSVNSGQMGILSGTSYTLNGLSPDESVTITLNTEGAASCGPNTVSATCVTASCPAIDIDIQPLLDVCLTANVDLINLDATVSGSHNGVAVWSGPGVVDAINGIVQPALAGPGQHNYMYTITDGPCVTSDSVTLNIFSVPDIQLFGSADTICTDESITLSFVSNAGPQAIINWNFAGGSASPGSGATPQDISWSTAGTRLVGLSVTENGCTSVQSTFALTVEAPLTPVVISCGAATTNSVSYTWLPVTGASGFQVTVLNGPAGLQTGNSYTINGLTPGQATGIRVTALNEGPCGPVSTDFSCNALDCPITTLSLSGSSTVCAGQPAMLTLNFSGGSAGPFTVRYQLNNGPVLSGVFTQGQTLEFPLSMTTTINVLGFDDNSLPGCTYTSGVSQTITVVQPVTAGIPANPASFCAGDTVRVALSSLLSGQTQGGQWTETSVTPSVGNAFNANAGTFSVSNQPPGIYQFRYFVQGPAPCPSDEATVSIIIRPSPFADAGPDQIITCNNPVVGIGGTGSSSGPGISYQWTTTTPGVIIPTPGNPVIAVSQAGTYRLTTINQEGCSASDVVTVSEDAEPPRVQTEITPVSCAGRADGAVLITGVEGGRPPYTYAFNGAPAGNQLFFSSLAAGSYTLETTDNNGCTEQLQINIQEPALLEVSLEAANIPGENTIALGDSIQLAAVVTGGSVLSSITWLPIMVPDGTFTVWVRPEVSSTFMVEVIDINGCRAEAAIDIQVDRTRRIYIPNAFSPNDDGVNDRFLIFAKAGQVSQVLHLRIHDRWGGIVFEQSNLYPNDLSQGWDGMRNGQLLNTGVYVYVAEIQYADGIIEVVKGEVVLMR
jgi:gliding motility-associated-like protein